MSSAVVMARDTSTPAATAASPDQPPGPAGAKRSAGMKRPAAHAPAAAMPVPRSTTGSPHGRPISGAVMALTATTETDTAGARKSSMSPRTRSAARTAAPGRVKISRATRNAGSASIHGLMRQDPWRGTPGSSLLDDAGLELHGPEAVHLGIDVVPVDGGDEADVAHLRANFQVLRASLDFHGLDDAHGVTVGQDVAHGILDHVFRGGLGLLNWRPLVGAFW